MYCTVVSVRRYSLITYILLTNSSIVKDLPFESTGGSKFLIISVQVWYLLLKHILMYGYGLKEIILFERLCYIELSDFFIYYLTRQHLKIHHHVLNFIYQEKLRPFRTSIMKRFHAKRVR